MWKGTSGGDGLRTSCPWSGKVLAEVQNPLDIGKGGEINKDNYFPSMKGERARN